MRRKKEKKNTITHKTKPEKIQWTYFWEIWSKEFRSTADPLVSYLEEKDPRFPPGFHCISRIGCNCVTSVNTPVKTAFRKDSVGPEEHHTHMVSLQLFVFPLTPGQVPPSSGIYRWLPGHIMWKRAILQGKLNIRSFSLWRLRWYGQYQNFKHCLSTRRK